MEPSDFQPDVDLPSKSVFHSPGFDCAPSVVAERTIAKPQAPSLEPCLMRESYLAAPAERN